jgi:hypothetical protein
LNFSRLLRLTTNSTSSSELSKSSPHDAKSSTSSSLSNPSSSPNGSPFSTANTNKLLNQSQENNQKTDINNNIRMGQGSLGSSKNSAGSSNGFDENAKQQQMYEINVRQFLEVKKKEFEEKFKNNGTSKATGKFKDVS